MNQLIQATICLFLFNIIFSCKLVDCYMSIIHQQNNNSTQSNILYSDLIAYFVQLNNCLYSLYRVRHCLQKSETRCGWIVRVSELYLGLPLPTYVEQKTQQGINYKFPSPMERSFRIWITLSVCSANTVLPAGMWGVTSLWNQTPN